MLDGEKIYFLSLRHGAHIQISELGSNVAIVQAIRCNKLILNDDFSTFWLSILVIRDHSSLGLFTLELNNPDTMTAGSQTLTLHVGFAMSSSVVAKTTCAVSVIPIP